MISATGITLARLEHALLLALCRGANPCLGDTRLVQPCAGSARLPALAWLVARLASMKMLSSFGKGQKALLGKWIDLFLILFLVSSCSYAKKVSSPPTFFVNCWLFLRSPTLSMPLVPPTLLCIHKCLQATQTQRRCWLLEEEMGVSCMRCSSMHRWRTSCSSISMRLVFTLLLTLIKLNLT